MKWWGSYELSMGRWGRWRIGPLSLFARPMVHEWQVAFRQYSDPLDSSLQQEAATDEEPDPDTHKISRYAVDVPDTRLELEPLLGDRPFIVSPDQPLFLLAGQKSVLYVSTIVWIQLKLADGAGQVIVDMPTIRRSDTWFGANTREGELCYATRTNAHTELDAVQPRAHRAVTPVEIRNEGTGILPVEQLRVPVPALSLYSDGDDRLWTDAVCFVRQEGEEQAAMTTPEPSAHLPGTRTRIQMPRAPIETGTIVAAFSKLLT